MSKIVNRLPYPISEKGAAFASALVRRGGRHIDYAVNGVPFLSAATIDDPMIIETAQMQREQQDQELEPGEQSLQGWWIRSQDSWHEGAGALFQEARGNVAPSSRYYTSSGIDVWEPGELRLLRRMQEASATSANAGCLFHNGQHLFLGSGSKIMRSTTGGVTVELHDEVGETITDIVATRAHVYAVTGTGKVIRTTTSAGGAVDVWTLSVTNPRFAPPKIAWAKHRLFVTYGRAFYVMTTEEATVDPIAPTYKHPTTDWSYTDIADGPSAVYLAGNSYAESSVQRVTLTETDGILEASPGVTTAVLPPGESIQKISILGGTWIGIGTDKGFRFGVIDQNGDVQYGPVFVEPEGSAECTGLHAHARFFYATWRTEDSKAVVYRIDSSMQFEDDTCAWAPDVEITTAGCFTDLYVTRGDRVVAAFEAGTYGAQTPADYWYQHETELVESGWIRMGNIRYRTTEPKVWKWLGVDIEPLAGTLAIDAVLETEALSPVITYTEQGIGEVQQSSISGLIGPQRQLGFQFTLYRSVTDSAEGPILHGYQVKAVPAVKPQRIIQLPLMCFDKEAWFTGQLDGHDGWAKERLDAVHNLEDAGDLVFFQDFSHKIVEGNLVKIESVQFRQSAPPNPQGKERGYGGVLTIVLRTMD